MWQLTDDKNGLVPLRLYTKDKYNTVVDSYESQDFSK